MYALCLLLAITSLLAPVLPQADPDPSSTTPPSFDVHARVRQQWREIQAICPVRTFRSCSDVNRTTWTDASRTTLSTLAFTNLGTWSSFKLTTYDSQGRPQSTGGDSWAVVLKEPSQRTKVATRVFDEADGTYTVATFLHHPGTYTVLARLYYSRCMGMQEPDTLPGGLTAELLTKGDHCYIGGKVQYPGVFTVEEGSSPALQPPLPPACGPLPPPAHPMVWNTDEYYLRQGNTLRAELCYRATVHKHVQPISRLFYYGDSTLRDMWTVLLGLAREHPCRVNLAPDLVKDVAVLNRGKHGMMFNSSVCPPLDSWAEVDPEMDAVLKRCTGGMPWASVPVGTNFLGINQVYPTSLLVHNIHRYKYDDRYERALDPPVKRPATARRFSVIFLDHHGCREPDHVMKDLHHLKLKPGDALLMNMGSWCYPALPFSQWRARIDGIAAGMATLVAKTGAMLVWRSSLVLQEHVFRRGRERDGGYSPGGLHFMTDMRRLEFDSYAMHVLSTAGMYIWDIHALSALGLNKHEDMVHASHPTDWVINKDLLDAFVCPV